MGRRRKHSVTTCKRCGADSQVEDTDKQNANHVRRVRACKECGLTWQTAEVPYEDTKTMAIVRRFMKELNK